MERDPVDAELELLRDFYRLWINMHQFANEKNMASAKVAAERLVQSHDAIEAFKRYEASGSLAAGHG